MFDVLFGNKNVEKILIFLFVNEQCYGTQLQRIFSTPLTPLQKVLLRLEKGGLISSHYEGKTRIYRFNQGFPLLSELQALLKKAYTLLPAHEKKLYYLGAARQKDTRLRNDTLQAFWKKLSSVQALTFSAQSSAEEVSGWDGQGAGEVIITKKTSNVLVFQEKGYWRGKEKNDVRFTNVFRWTNDRLNGMVSLEHLRRGEDNPVFLFHLAPTSEGCLTSVDSHLCANDAYFGKVEFDRFSLKLTWRVIGPKKNERIEYRYL